LIRLLASMYKVTRTVVGGSSVRIQLVTGWEDHILVIHVFGMLIKVIYREQNVAQVVWLTSG